MRSPISKQGWSEHVHLIEVDLDGTVVLLSLEVDAKDVEDPWLIPDVDAKLHAVGAGKMA